ncbi:receptor-like protein eix2 [Quercus suber]|uniref:Receptor-like protein eix2 n=1 Tax=Quercus suber TaxID=58331 RepID=A0AAW0M1S5_QUESU
MSSVNLSKVNNWLQVVNKLPYLSSLHLESCNLPSIFSVWLVNSSTSLHSLDLSDNSLTSSSSVLQWLFNFNTSVDFLGELPNCWMHFEGLKILNLANNHFHGKIPNSIGSLLGIEILDLSNNSFTGELPSSLKNCTKLKFVNLRDNKLSGQIPMWLGSSHPDLVVLFLRSNHFFGSIPSHLCHLTHLQLLDLALNHISGSIPKCINSLTALTSPVLLTFSTVMTLHFGCGKEEISLVILDK